MSSLRSGLGSEQTTNDDNNRNLQTIPPSISHSFSTGASTYTIQESRPYKGFSTKFCALFMTSGGSALPTPLPCNNNEEEEEEQYHYQHELQTSHLRTDLCSIPLFGVLQSDHTRYLFTHTRPPSFRKRMCLHILTPLIIFLLAGWMSGHVHNNYMNNVICTSLIWFIFIWIVVGCIRGRKKRIMVREELLWRLMRREEKMQKRRNERVVTKGKKRLHDMVESATSVSLSVDSAAEEEEYEYYSEDEEEYHRNASSLGLLQLGQSSSGDLCAELWMPFTTPCLTCIPCGNSSYGCHFQSCGICAIAQEAREANLTLPRHLRMVDYITMEPFLLYYPRVLELRVGRSSSLLEHCGALSDLSKLLLHSLGVVLVIMLVLSLWDAIGYWELADVAVLAATFLQSFGVMYIVHWGWHRYDLSVDSVIKYFACGFALCSGMAFGLELLMSGGFRLVLVSVVWLLGVQEVNDNGYGGGMREKTNEWSHTLYNRLLELSGDSDEFGSGRSLSEDQDVLHGFFYRHPVAKIVYIIVTSYVFAGLIEEVCKYFGFVMVDVPDFCSERELTKAKATMPLQLLRDRAEDEEEDSQSDQEGRKKNAMTNIQTSASVEMPLSQFDPAMQRRSLASLRAGVTVAMIAVALGFACCENLLHIFIYNRSSLSSEIRVLFIKSVFPIHPIAAAIQSVQVCRRDIEKDSSVGLGRIVLPSIIVHGTYDCALLLISNNWQRSNKENYFTSGGDGTTGVAVTSFIVSCAIVLTGIMYYFVRSRAQYMRLKTQAAGTTTSGSMGEGLLA
ncbi:predicted protein [Thalassiosira pseudonana CCMP1335]|uniref:Transmembrane protein n=1 Tax=Thalassiosira pseudonana TaxID=35128 RepID=B8C6I0_THAPS|nr:predicted protein [Thalassiosira pseudonana CCMP1335]EED90809.1 predicted protein [Thalassiosira pseudonana CCMP1335]